MTQYRERQQAENSTICGEEALDMELSIKLEYMENYLPTPRHRKLRQRDVTEGFSVEIPEATAAEAPVVLRTHDLKRYCDGIQPTDYRTFHGRLYTPVRMCDMVSVNDQERANRPFPIEDLPHYFRTYGCVSREEAIQQHKERAENYLLVDGALWQCTGEPMYEVCTFGLGHNHGGTALMITNHFNSNCRWENYYTALQHEEAVEAAVKVALARGDTKYVDSIRDKRYYIEVLDPSAVRADPKAWGGKGDSFLNALDAITSSASSSMEAGLLAIAYTGAAIQPENKRLNLTEQIQTAEEKKLESEAVISSGEKEMER